MNCWAIEMNTSSGNWNDNVNHDYSDNHNSSPYHYPPQESSSSRILSAAADYRAADYISHPGPYDVLCGRDREAFNNIGNRRFRVTVNLSLDAYVNSKARQDKSLIIINVINTVRGNGGRFIKWKDDRWVELTEKQTREKVGHCFRDVSLFSFIYYLVDIFQQS